MVVLLQARCSSTRFPRKILSELFGTPMVLFQIERILQTSLVKKVIVVTSLEQSDDELCQLLESHGVTYFRGDLHDVNSRFRSALVEFELTSGYVMRLTADCPLICPEILDLGIETIRRARWDYFSNTVTRTFPDGLDFEIFDSAVFIAQPQRLLTDFAKEHVTPHFYQNPSRYSIGQLVSSNDYSALRITVDFEEDLRFISELVDLPEYNPLDGRYAHILKLYGILMQKKKSPFELRLDHQFTTKQFRSMS